MNKKNGPALTPSPELPVYWDTDDIAIYPDSELISVHLMPRLTLKERGYLIREMCRAASSPRPSRLQRLLLAITCHRPVIEASEEEGIAADE